MTQAYFTLAFSGLLVLLVIGAVLSVLSRFWFGRRIVSLRMVRRVLILTALLLLVDTLLVWLRPDAGSPSLIIDAVAHAGWWELRYPAFITANEMHIPVQQPVMVRFHSQWPQLIWMPALPARRDRLVGRQIRLQVSAPSTGVYNATELSRAGMQRLIIIADPSYEQWARQQMAPAAAGGKGVEVFRTARCTFCHTVRGVALAEQPLGPDLTHLMSRQTIGNGAAPNRAGFLAGWVVDPQGLKPEAEMPTNAIEPHQLQELLAFLHRLR